jgi:hypothetical protein
MLKIVLYLWGRSYDIIWQTITMKCALKFVQTGIRKTASVLCTHVQPEHLLHKREKIMYS